MVYLLFQVVFNVHSQHVLCAQYTHRSPNYPRISVLLILHPENPAALPPPTPHPSTMSIPGVAPLLKKGPCPAGDQRARGHPTNWRVSCAAVRRALLMRSLIRGTGRVATAAAAFLPPAGPETRRPPDATLLRGMRGFSRPVVPVSPAHVRSRQRGLAY